MVSEEVEPSPEHAAGCCLALVAQARGALPLTVHRDDEVHLVIAMANETGAILLVEPPCNLRWQRPAQYGETQPSSRQQCGEGCRRVIGMAGDT